MADRRMNAQLILQRPRTGVGRRPVWQPQAAGNVQRARQYEPSDFARRNAIEIAEKIRDQRGKKKEGEGGEKEGDAARIVAKLKRVKVPDGICWDGISQNIENKTLANFWNATAARPPNNP